ncbi:MAG: hypothetical protein AAFV93_17540 [Chloroflexota bacterium]
MTTPLMPSKDGTWRVYQVSIETDVRKGAASKYITEYLQAIGFSQTQISPTMIFERGATLASMYNFNPKAQKTEVSVDFASVGNQTIIELTMRINCLGNRPLSKDYEFWAAEIAGIEDVLEHGYVNPYISAFAAERAFWYNVTVALIVWSLLLIIVISLTMAILFLPLL